MLAVLTMLMLGTALSAVILMRGVLRDLEHINSLAMIGTTASSSMGASITNIEAELIDWTRTSEIDEQLIARSMESIEGEIDQLRDFYSMESEGNQSFDRLVQCWDDLEQSVGQLAAAPIETAMDHAQAARESSDQMRLAVMDHADFAFVHMNSEQDQVTAQFRWMAISLAIIFVVLINVSIILLIRAASWIIKPVDRLIEASRHLAKEEYDYRVEVGRKDEFDELATGFNRLAQHMETNEQRKIETLHQVARTLNHELNNAIAIIELQLRMVANSPGYDPASGKQLELIHETLHRMNKTVNALIHVRRVVLTDYTEGVKMLDLERSTQDQSPGGLDTTQAHEVITP